MAILHLLRAIWISILWFGMVFYGTLDIYGKMIAAMFGVLLLCHCACVCLGFLHQEQRQLTYIDAQCRKYLMKVFGDECFTIANIASNSYNIPFWGSFPLYGMNRCFNIVTIISLSLLGFVLFLLLFIQPV